MKPNKPRHAPSSIQPKRNCSSPISKHPAISTSVSSASRSPFYGQVTRDQARLNLRVVGERVFAGDIREREHLLSASLTVATSAGIKELFLSYQTAGVRFSQKLKREPWGATTFIVIDPDGNLILFAGPADQKTD